MPWIMLAIGVIAVLAARERPTKKLSELAHDELSNPHSGYTHFVIYQDTRGRNHVTGRFTSLDDADRAIRDSWGFGSGFGVYFVYSYESGSIVTQHAHLR